MENMEKVWKLYRKTNDPQLREKLILQYAPIVKFVAGRLVAHIGQHVDFEDLISYGIFGLIDAIDKFDADKGVKFETYASVRIRGSIIDNIRKMDWVPRTLRQKNRQLETSYAELEASLGREPTDEELAEKLQMTLEDTQELMRRSSVASLISLDDYMDQNHEVVFQPTTGNPVENPEAAYEKQELKKMLADAIDGLTEKEKQVITFYYFEELTLKEISAIMGVSESRISQIHSKAVMRLQVKLGKYRGVLFAT